LAQLTAENPASDESFFCGEPLNATVTANPAPTFNITANIPDPFCAADGTVPVSFTVQSSVPPGNSASDWNLVATPTPNSGVTCTGPSVTGPTGEFCEALAAQPRGP
jgi:hypothetical protein